MEIEFYLYSLLLIPLVAGRAMMTICGSALAAYFVKHPALLEYFEFKIDIEAARLLTGLPEWMQTPWFIALTFILALVENMMNRSPELQDIWNMTEAKLKAVFSFIICFVLIKGDPLLLIEHLKEEGISTDFGGFFSVEYVWSFIIGSLTWLLCKIRSGVYAFLIEIDDSDSMGMRKLLGRIEGGMGIFGPLIFIILPSLALMAAGVALLIIVALRLWVKRTELKHSVACDSCQHINHLSALHCGQCERRLEHVLAVGFMGLSKRDTPMEDVQQHKLDLLRVKRCPHCAAASSEKKVDMDCGVCKKPLFASAEEVNDYLRSIRKRLAKTLVVTSIFGFIPIVGLIPGIIFYRLYLVAGLRNYVSKGSNFFIRLLLRILFIFLIIYQLTPIIGFAAIPIMALANYLLYSGSIRSQIGKVKNRQTRVAQIE